MKNLIKVSSFIFILVVFISCHKDQTTTPIVYTDQGNIGIQGGTVKTADGASVEIPAGALSTNQTISIDNVTSSLQKFNTGCRIYEMNPDGLTFSDSITIKLPFNNSNLNQNSSDKNYGVRVMVYYKDEWDILPSVVDLKNNSVSVKSKHFSKYAVSYSSDLTDFFINKQKSPGKVLNVPYYFQAGGWCAYYSTSMVSIYSGMVKYI